MKPPLKIAMVGVGRIGAFHARHIQLLARERQDCRLVAVVDQFDDTARQMAAELQQEQHDPITPFTDVTELAESGLCDAAIIASRTEHHERDARTLVQAGYRVLLEKPLADSLESAERFCRELDTDPKTENAVMLAFQRRFDEALRAAKSLLDAGKIGRAFKFVSVLEDPQPPPSGYSSPGIVIDMAVHNVDEILWFSKSQPTHLIACGANLYSHAISSVQEDFDDAFVQLWFPKRMLGQIQVSRNHVAGYRNELWVYGEAGLIHVGHFQANPYEVLLESYSSDGVIELRRFDLMKYGDDAPVFIKRFGMAYKMEVAHFVDCCLQNRPFSVTHRDGLAAMRIAAAAQAALLSESRAVALGHEAK